MLKSSKKQRRKQRQSRYRLELPQGKNKSTTPSASPHVNSKMNLKPTAIPTVKSVQPSSQHGSSLQNLPLSGEKKTSQKFQEDRDFEKEDPEDQEEEENQDIEETHGGHKVKDAQEEGQYNSEEKYDWHQEEEIEAYDMEFQDIEGFRKKDKVEKSWKRGVDLMESVDESIYKEREETKTEETDYQNLKRKLDFSKIKKTPKKLTPIVSITLK